MLKESIAKDIIQKRELGSLSISFVISRIDFVLRQEPKLAKKIIEPFDSLKRTSAYKELIKLVRADLREIYGVFQVNTKKRDKLFEEIKQEGSDKTRVALQLLNTHQSTKERAMHYPLMFRQLEKLMPEPKTVLDIGCGLDPLGFVHSSWKPEFMAIDIAQKDMEQLQEAMESLGYTITTQAQDVTQQPVGGNYDLCLMLKVIDTLESNQRGISKSLLNSIESKRFLLSFPRFSLGGKRDIAKTKHAWVEKLISRVPALSIKERFETPNEIFYLIERHGITQP